MIVFTEAGDTPASVTNRMLGYNDESYSQKLSKMNANGFARQMMNDSGYFAPYRAVWLPGFSRHDQNVMLREQLVHHTEFMRSSARANIQRLGRDGIDINRLIGAQKTIAAYNQWEMQNPHSMASVYGAQMGGEILNRAVEHAGHPAEKFAKSMRILNGSMQDLIEAENVQDFELMKSLRPQVVSAYREAGAELNKASRLYSSRLDLFTREALSDPVRAMRFKRNGGIMLDHLDDVKALEKIGSAGKFIGRAGFGFQLAMGGVEVYRTYENGGDWEGEATGVIGESAVIYTVGEVCLLFTPAGWVALVVVAVAEGIFMTRYGEEVKDYFKSKFDDLVEGKWQWHWS